jgi:DNA (cytosine-5)-methyltransferase 1
VNVGSTFSGVGGFDLGFERAGMRVVWQAEIDEWCRRVLRNHWPKAQIYNDVKEVGGSAPAVDLLCGGFPCQDLSVAGKRAGLAGERSGLFFEFARIADELRPRWIVLENVAGLLSATNGRDFGILLATLAEIGYGDLAWRLVCARYFGVPQRRRRVFIVGHLGGGGERAVRALGAGGEGNLAAGDCSWQTSPPVFKRGVGNASSVITEATAKCLTTSNQRLDSETESFVVTTEPSVSARRLTPTECERLMGWPDDWTAIDGDKTPDGRRYSACGNGVVANVSEWIGRRIMAIEELDNQ